jgi:hypothetical protein
MEDSRYPHLKAMKRILRYIKGTEDLRLFYQKTNIFEFASYMDTDWCGDINDRKRTLGYAFYMGDNLYMVVEEAAHRHTIHL